MNSPSFSHLMPLFLILTEESGNSPVSSVTIASPTLRSLIVLYVLALLAMAIAWPPLVWQLFLLCNKNKNSLFSSATASISHLSVHFYEKKVILPIMYHHGLNIWVEISHSRKLKWEILYVGKDKLEIRLVKRAPLPYVSVRMLTYPLKIQSELWTKCI